MAEQSEQLMLRATLIERHISELRDKLEFVSSQLSELEEFNAGFSSLKDTKDKEMLASLGKGIYIKAKPTDDKLLVNVGAGVIVKKSQEETKGIIEFQIKSFKEARLKLMSELELYESMMAQIVSSLENSPKK